MKILRPLCVLVGESLLFFSILRAISFGYIVLTYAKKRHNDEKNRRRKTKDAFIVVLNDATDDDADDDDYDRKKRIKKW